MSFIEGLELGGSGPKRLTGTAPIVGNFFCIKGRGVENMVINTLEIAGSPTTEWDGAVLTPGDYLLFAKDLVTKITLLSGEGDGYRI